MNLSELNDMLADVERRYSDTKLLWRPDLETPGKAYVNVRVPGAEMGFAVDRGTDKYELAELVWHVYKIIRNTERKETQWPKN